ncbi:hypothetical protein [Paraglaciecola polaris]|uniref:Uncharacterized protein n=1 Tax=Paraglaciecola polaris LMG 21857 TaxID=1129793 RepID=K6YJE4_9ALTE|nr:hypothetical protein [Paraglaciecola polaris]GAC32834.1 hypothetical protein GPLA_1927 [Paraglaciecola polaris LMG 21857]
MNNEYYQELERKLAEDILANQVLPEPEALAAKVTKQDKSKEIVRLGVHGVHGVFSMLLTLFAPLMMSHSKKLLKKKVKSQ